MQKIQAMRRAVLHVDRILTEEIPKWLYTGITEQQVFHQIQDVICADKSFGLSFDPIVAFGPSGADPHHTPTNRELEIGDPVLIDCGAIFQGWCSDCTRMFCFGEPTDRFYKKFQAVFIAHKKAIPRFAAGAECSVLDAQTRVDLGSDAPYFIHTLGHGVGKEVHTEPRIGSDSKAVLQEGDSVTCEPGIYFPGEFGVRIEDQLIIQKSGTPEILTLAPQELGIIDAWGGIRYRK